MGTDDCQEVRQEYMYTHTHTHTHCPRESFSEAKTNLYVRIPNIDRLQVKLTDPLDPLTEPKKSLSASSLQLVCS